MKVFIFLLVALTFVGKTYAYPVAYDLSFSDSGGGSGNGRVTIDSHDLALISDSGLYESPIGFYTEMVSWLGATVNGLLFDGWRNGFPVFIAADGKLSDVTALGNDTPVGCDPKGGLGFGCELDIFSRDNTYLIYEFDDDENRQIIAQGYYTMTRVSEPGSFALLALGLAGLGIARKSRINILFSKASCRSI